MPLEHSSSKEAFSHNVSAEVEAGKPLKQALAIAYEIKRNDDIARIKHVAKSIIRGDCVRADSDEAFIHAEELSKRMAHEMGDPSIINYAHGRSDEDKWITVHPHGGIGTPVLIGEDGTVKAGMGGKFNGKNIKDAHGTKKFTSGETNAETEVRHTEASNGVDKANRPENKAVYSPSDNGKHITVSAKGVKPVIIGAKFEKEAKEYYEGLKTAENPVEYAENWHNEIKKRSEPSSTETEARNKPKPVPIDEPVTVRPEPENRHVEFKITKPENKVAQPIDTGAKSPHTSSHGKSTSEENKMENISYTVPSTAHKDLAGKVLTGGVIGRQLIGGKVVDTVNFEFNGKPVAVQIKGKPELEKLLSAKKEQEDAKYKEMIESQREYEKTIPGQREKLRIAEENSYSENHPPGSAAWHKNMDAQHALREFDKLHPEFKRNIDANFEDRKKAASLQANREYAENGGN